MKTRLREGTEGVPSPSHPYAHWHVCTYTQVCMRSHRGPGCLDDAPGPEHHPRGEGRSLAASRMGHRPFGHVQEALGSGEVQGGVWASPPARQTLPPPIHPQPGKTRALVSGQERREEGGWGEATDGGQPQPGAVAAWGLCSGHGPLQWPSILGAGVGPRPGLPEVGVQGAERCGPPGPGHWDLQLLCWARPWRPRGPGGEGCWLALPSFPLGPKAPGGHGNKGWIVPRSGPAPRPAAAPAGPHGRRLCL